jgi:hypothetical protein
MTARAARILVACALFGMGAHAQASLPGDTPGTRVTAEPEVQPAPALVTAPRVRRADPAQVARVTLDRPALAAVNKSAAAEKAGAPLQIGFGRPVAELASAASTVGRLRWTHVPGGGQVAAFSIASPEALAIRAGLRFDALPAQTLLRFYAPADIEAIEVTAEHVRETVGRNLDASGQGEDARTFWSPVIEGPAVVVEIELAAGVSPDALALAAPVVSHLLTAPSINFAMPSTKAAACHLDATCYGAWASESNSVARIAFVDGGSSYLCTGTLVADTDTGTSIPYFITANHCVDNQSAASSLVSYWFYRATSCGSGSLGASQTLGGGATLVYHSTSTDTSFMRLNASPPAGAVYAGWSVGGSGPLGSNVAGLHNPTGDLQKITFGSVSNYSTCSPTGTGSFSCRGASLASATFYEVSWSSGTTEPGSSGSGVFTENGHYLLGQLYGGSTSCASPGADFYGRFDVAYNAGMGTYLNGGTFTPTPSPTQPTLPTVFTPALDYSALWWNPGESGWGLSVTQHTSAIFAAWFMYEAGGNARWMVLPAGTWTSPTTFTGDLYATSGPQSNQPWSPVSTQRVGTATLSFSSATAAVLSYTVNGVSGSKAIQRQNFGVADATPVASYGDLWWNSGESGWGLSINQQYRTLFAVWYTYGLWGQPVWYVMPGGSWNGDTYSGTLYRTSTAPLQFLTGSFDPRLVSSTAVGSLSLRFSSTTSATMTYTVDGVTGSRSIARQPF